MVGAAIIEGLQVSSLAGGGRRVLAAQRSESMSHPLQWEFPGGKVEVGESPEDALVREIREELAIEIEVGERLGSSLLQLGEPERPRCLLLEVYFCRWIGGQVQLAEHRTWRWITGSQVSALPWSPADRPLLTKLRRHLEGEA